MLNSSYILIGLKVSSIKIEAMLKSVTLICTYVLCCSALFAQQINIIPQPLSVITKKDKFTITSATKLVVKDKKDYATASFLSKYFA